MKMIDYILLMMITILIIFCVKKGFGHVKGEGSCCGGKANLHRKLKKLDGKVIDSTVIKIEGMKCENCAIKIENEINQIEGIKAIVSLNRGEACIDSTHQINQGEIKNLIQRLGYIVKQV